MLERLAAIVTLHHADHFGRQPVLLLEPTNLQTGLEAQRQLCLSIDQLLLYELERRKWALELLPLERICEGFLDTILQSSHGAPRDPIPDISGINS